MRARTALLVLAGLAAFLPGGAPAAVAGDTAAPHFQCSTQAWQEDFEVSGPRYDSARRLLVWDLKAKKKVKARGYEAFMTDADSVEMARVKVRLNPARPEYKKGTALQAAVKLPGRGILDEVARLDVRVLPR